jgi:DNA-binding transcriptional regulator of glucitol operon
MKRIVFRNFALVVLTLGFALVSAAYASDNTETKFSGVIESLPNTAGFIGDWRVSGRSIHVTAATRIEQEKTPVAVGATVKVQGKTRSDNTVDAEEIDVKEAAENDAEVKFQGTVETIPGTPGFTGDWRVGGRTIHVSSSTRIQTEDGPVAVGAFVEIEGMPRTDGSMDASKIEVKSNVNGGDGHDDLKGAIESLPSTPGFVGDWKVSGRTVHVTVATVIDQEHGPVAVGALIEVKGTIRVDGSIDATKIEIQSASSDSGGSTDEGQSAKLNGSIQSLPTSTNLIGDWMIADRVVHVTSSTKLKNEHGAFAVGTRVKAKGLKLADGSFVATKIQVSD